MHQVSKMKKRFFFHITAKHKVPLLKLDQTLLLLTAKKKKKKSLFSKQNQLPKINYQLVINYQVSITKLPEK